MNKCNIDRHMQLRQLNFRAVARKQDYDWAMLFVCSFSYLLVVSNFPLLKKANKNINEKRTETSAKVCLLLATAPCFVIVSRQKEQFFLLIVFFISHSR